MYNELLNELETLKGTIVNFEMIDDLFAAYDWTPMGENKEMTKSYYIESPMGKEIDLEIEMISKDCFIINDYIKRWWND